MKKLTVLTVLLFCLCGCAGEKQEDLPEASYRRISQEEAKRIMEEETDYLIIDVRTEEEFKEGHIPGALNIPNETIIDARPSQLPDSTQVLLIYCRSGNRSRQAAQKLADMGYVNVYEFGGINTWDGEITTEE